MKAYIPNNLNLGAEKHSDKYYFILTFIFYGNLKDKRNEVKSFIELNSLFLKSIIGGRYKTYLQHLIDLGVIETDNFYVVKTKSKGYRLTEKYRNVKAKQVEITDKNILQNYAKLKRRCSNGISLKQHKYILSCLEQIEIQYEEAKYFIESTITNIDEYFSYSYSIDLIKAKDWFFVVDKTAGRIHNNITNLSKNLRPFLRYQNQNLVEIDIANSQPFLFNVLIQNYCLHYLLTITPTSGNLNLSYVHPNYTEYPDIGLFRQLTAEGKFYEYLMNEWSIKEERSLFKLRFFKRVFYSKENKKYVFKERKKFQELFPTIAQVISFYKRDDYCRLAIELQRIEADIVINRIVPKLAEQKIFIVTIHDSFLTTYDNCKVVEKTILEVFENSYGLKPTVRIKGGK
ncbi:MAG: hypothetical protein RDU14_15210 [Melioribacteraceae bacterium]|nr:hypothetical protein [Melioribacteraceae bacterium]